ncbi:RES domain-containing protein [Lewinella marina]|uniref:RES superfamily protein n=1 Tax=Neolewinella marina TaxID=438751 RepID=A0A2G0CIL1_9BACT|nr:RES family NAD+ phosphorylase [Neolewinella marina]NJB85031.1 RES domain-containing protein [Neolewinella marina]PHK99821.1 RES superfamily protein [Neolewinella marina]
MLVYRIAKKQYIRDLSGTGAKLYGGRWNPKGYAMLYTSENKSLAALEVLVHLSPGTVPDDLIIATLRLPDGEVSDYEGEALSTANPDPPTHRFFAEAGKAWLDSRACLAWKVPSVLIPGEHNILINPSHHTADQIQLEALEPFTFDERFFIW